MVSILYNNNSGDWQASYVRKGIEACGSSTVVLKQWFNLVEDGKRLTEQNLGLLYEQMLSMGWACKNILLSTQEQARYSFIADWAYIYLLPVMIGLQRGKWIKGQRNHDKEILSFMSLYLYIIETLGISQMKRDALYKSVSSGCIKRAGVVQNFDWLFPCCRLTDWG